GTHSAARAPGSDRVDQLAQLVVPERLDESLLVFVRPRQEERAVLAAPGGARELRESDLRVEPQRVHARALDGRVAEPCAQQTVGVDANAVTRAGAVRLRHRLERRVE